MIDEKISQSEVDAILKVIERIKRKCVFSYLGMGAGIFVCILSILYLAKNPTIIAGSLSLLAIGAFVFIINKISLKDYKKRIEELNIDLKKTQERLFNQKDY
ncbi:MAG: hypothetical protein SOU19_09265 [Candidatus Caccosoma sp.]|nr:hypothetical protein [Candidatus Caccosoma sp.]